LSRIPALLATLLLATACSTSPPGVDSENTMSDDEPIELPPVPNEPDEDPVPAPQGVETFTGRLEIDPVPQGKRFQGTWLHTDDGDSFVMGYRPVEEYYPFVGRRVVVHGEQVFHPPEVQQISARHLRVDSIELAPGEEPREVIDGLLPAPPVVEDIAGLAEFQSRWVQLVGELSLPEEGDAFLTLAEGSLVRLRYSRRSDLEGHQGQLTTVVGIVENPETLTAIVAACPGRAERCGMDRDPDYR
jgi:hypothetical protein